MNTGQFLRRTGWAILLAICLLSLQGVASAEDLFTYQTENLSYSLGVYTDIFAIEESQDGGFFIGGYAYKTDSDDHAFLMKTGPVGDEIWHTVYPSSRIISIKELEDGKIIGAALSEQVNPDSPTAAITGSGYLFMADSKGNLIWSEELPGDAPAEIIISGEEIILVGWTWAPADNPEAVKGFLYRYNLSGTRIDTEVYDEVSIHDIIQDHDEGYLLVGNTGDPQESIFVRYGHLTKVDVTGAPLWNTTYGNRSLFAITEMDDGYIMVGGTLPYGYSEGEAWAMGISQNGTTLWEEKLQGYAAYGIAPFGDEFLIAGVTGPGNPLLVSITPEGVVTDSKRLLGADGRFTAIAPISKGRVAVGGWSRHTGDFEGSLLVFDHSVGAETTKTPGFGLLVAALGIVGAALWQSAKKRD